MDRKIVVKVKDRNIELNSTNLGEIFSNLEDKDLIQLYNLYLFQSTTKIDYNLSIFEKLNNLLIQKNMRLSDFENEIDILKNFIEIKNNIIEKQVEQLLKLKYEIDCKVCQIECTSQLIRDSLQEIIDLKIQYAFQLRDTKESIEKFNNEKNADQLLIQNLTDQINAFHNSATYRIVRLISIVLFIINPHKFFFKLRNCIITHKNRSVILKSNLFDNDYYLKNNPDVAISGIDPVKHYLIHGGFEGRSPSENFDSFFYLSSYSDVTTAGINPLLHYALFGKMEGRNIKPVLDKHIN